LNGSQKSSVGDYSGEYFYENDRVSVDKSGKIVTQRNLYGLNNILAPVASGGNVFITACYADNNLGPVLQNYVRKDIDIYMNSEYTKVTERLEICRDLSETIYSIRNPYQGSKRPTSIL